jgi:nucleoside-diphosphate-sugar epimerase
MNILVTGGTGFIGKRLVEKLLAKGASITVLTRDKRKIDASVAGRIDVIESDISDKKYFGALKIRNINAVVHLAACINYNAGKEVLFKTNVEGTKNVLELAGKLRIKKFVHISSIEAIGPVNVMDFPAGEDQPCRPVNSYGESKLDAEQQALRMGTELKMDTAILRLGNVYGPGSLSFVLPIANTLRASNKAWLYSNWHRHLWHPVYIDDAVAGIVNAVETKIPGGVYIVTGAEPATVGRLAGIVARELGIDIEPLIRAVRTGGKWAKLRDWFRSMRHFRTNWVYSIGKARRELGYSPQVGLEEGIRRTIEWAKKEGSLTR